MSEKDIDAAWAELAAVRTPVIGHVRSETRLIRASGNLLDFFGTRTEDGCRLTAEWGEPVGSTSDGGLVLDIYEPVFTVHEDDRLGELDAAWADAEAAASARGLIVAEAYREELGCQSDGTCPYGRWWVYAQRDRHDDDPIIGKGETLPAALRALAEKLRASNEGGR